MSFRTYKYKENRKHIPKEKLKNGHYYRGHCRNASIAKWDEGKGVFWYWRHKFGECFIESIHVPEDDDGYDLFFAEEEIPFDQLSDEQRTL